MKNGSLPYGFIDYCVCIDEAVDNVLECFDGFYGVINLSHANNVFNIINICHSKLERIVTSIIGRVKVMLRVNITDSSITEACLVTDLSVRKTRIK